MPTPALPELDKQRCTATAKRSGKQCHRYCKPGFTVCDKHGAKAPQVIRRAELRAETMRAELRAALAEKAEEMLGSLMEDAVSSGSISERVKVLDLYYRYTLPAQLEAMTAQLELRKESEAEQKKRLDAERQDGDLDRDIAEAFGLDWDLIEAHASMAPEEYAEFQAQWNREHAQERADRLQHTLEDLAEYEDVMPMLGIDPAAIPAPARGNVIDVGSRERDDGDDVVEAVVERDEYGQVIAMWPAEVAG